MGRNEPPQHVDVLIVGAGLSGIATAVHLTRGLPGASYAVLESRRVSGGTWDLFRYPGVRSDSDMFSLGFSFRPWKSPVAIADGASILRYLRETAAEYGVEDRIRYGHRVVSASWSGTDARWRVTIELEDGSERLMTCGYLCLTTGHYDYADPYVPPLPGLEKFAGTVVHPQFWPADLDTDGARIVVIGSGATAMSLVPAIAARAASTVLLQRSPTYVVSLASRNAMAATAFARLPARVAAALVRAVGITTTSAVWHASRLAPRRTADRLIGGVRRLLPAGYPVDRHFTPRYRPWDQRLCVVPDADLFTAIGAGDVEMVTGQIETFTPGGLRLRDGTELPATLVVTATGLRVALIGGIRLDLDGEPIDAGARVMYKGTMLAGVPNLSVTLGYANASWTLKAELSARFVVRVLRYLREHDQRIAVPTAPPTADRRPLMDLTSGYLERARGSMPTQGRRWPWRLYSSYWPDALLMRTGRVDGPGLRFLP